jgi:hypothetical protein
MQGHDEFYENVEGKYFERKSRRTFPATPWGTMGIKVFDYDNDGRFDVFLTDMHTDMAKDLGPTEEKQKIPREAFDMQLLATNGNHVWGNALFHNDGTGSFAEVSEPMNTETYWPWGLSAGDLNADGFCDVFITASMNFPYRYGINSLLLNDRGRRFVDSEFVLGVEPRRAGRTATPWFELDIAGKDADHPMSKALASKGRVVSRAVFWGALGSRSSVIFDLENDGDLDIVTNDFNSPPMVLVSDLAQRKPELRFLKVQLQGTKSNRDGLGAMVRVRAGDDVYTIRHDGQSGYLSQSSCPLYFGLAEHEAVDAVEVDWPSGDKQTIAGPIEINRLLEIVEGS